MENGISRGFSILGRGFSVEILEILVVFWRILREMTRKSRVFGRDSLRKGLCLLGFCDSLYSLYLSLFLYLVTQDTYVSVLLFGYREKRRKGDRHSKLSWRKELAHLQKGECQKKRRNTLVSRNNCSLCNELEHFKKGECPNQLHMLAKCIQNYTVRSP